MSAKKYSLRMRGAGAIDRIPPDDAMIDRVEELRDVVARVPAPTG